MYISEHNIVYTITIAKYWSICWLSTEVFSRLKQSFFTKALIVWHEMSNNFTFLYSYQRIIFPSIWGNNLLQPMTIRSVTCKIYKPARKHSNKKTCERKNENKVYLKLLHARKDLKRMLSTAEIQINDCQTKWQIWFS